MIEIRHLTKQYGSHTAVSDLSLTVEPGKIYGFLGPNGAGKSTTMNIMTGCLSPTEGTVRIGGFDILEEPRKAKRLLGYLPEQPPLYLGETPEEYLQFVGAAKGLRGAELRRQVEDAVERTGLPPVRHQLIGTLSKGYRQRVGIAQALLGDPHVVILDEPTVGLDPIQIIEIRDLIKTLGKTHTVILSSHILSEVRAVCDEIMILSNGKLVASDTPENLEKLFAGSMTLEMTVRGEQAAIAAALSAIPGVRGVSFCAGEVEGAQGVTVETDPPADLSEDVFRACAGANLPILRMSMKTASLEDIFLELTADPAEKIEAEGGRQSA